MAYEFRLPDVGEGIAEAEIVRWLVQEGETVRLDQPLVEIETDKAVVEVPAPVAGVLARQGGQPGDTLHVGDLLAVLNGAGSAASAQVVADPATPATPTIPVAAAPPSQATPRRPLATPAVRHLARELHVSLADVEPAGSGARVTAEDVQRAAQHGGAAPAAEPPAAAASARQAPGVEELRSPSARPAPLTEDERIPLRGLRKRIAESMSESWRTIPHVTGMDEVEVSDLVGFRERLNRTMAAQGVHLSYLPFVVKAVVAALRQYPAVNASLDEAAGEIVYHHRYNIGIATATPEGLIVPVVHDADQKTLRDLAVEIASLSEQARSRSIALPALQGGTFTITNFGSLGGWLGTPIIRPGEAAILGVGRIQDRAWPVERRLEVRPVLALSFSADHRLIDGDVSTLFMKAVAGYLGDPLTLFAELV